MSGVLTSLLENNQMVKKHIATVHVEANLSLLERKMFNVLLLNAYPKLLQQKNHKMRYTALCELIGYDSGDRLAIKKALRNIAKTQIEWIGTNDKGKEVSWKVYNYLSSAEIKWGADSFEYGFDEKLAEHLYNPEVFAQISLISQRKFSSKYTLNLYENCARYRKNKKFKGLTPVWDIDLFRKFMGIGEAKLYSTFAELNRRILKPSIKEINEHSDIYLDLEIFKEGRKVSGLQFQVTDNPNQAQMKLPGVEDETEIANASDNPAVRKCIELGVGEGVSIQWLKSYGEAYMMEKIQLAETAKKEARIRTSVAGWLVRAVRDNYQNENPSAQLAEQKKITRETKRQQQEKQWEEADQHAEEIRKKREDSRLAVNQYLESLTEDALQVQQTAFIDALSLNLEKTLSEIDTSHHEAFHDWIAEQNNLGNPYPVIRANRQKQKLLDKVSLPD